MASFDDGIYIDGVQYKVPIISCDTKPSALWKYAERTEDGVHNGEILGVYFNYTFECGNIVNQNVYKSLINKLTEPVEYHIMRLPNQYGNFINVEVYFSVDSLAIKKSIDGVTTFKGLKFQAICRRPTRA